MSMGRRRELRRADATALVPGSAARAARPEAPQSGDHHGRPALVSGKQGRTALLMSPGGPSRRPWGVLEGVQPGPHRRCSRPELNSPGLPCLSLPEASRRSGGPGPASQGPAVQHLHLLPGA